MLLCVYICVQFRTVVGGEKLMKQLLVIVAERGRNLCVDGIQGRVFQQKLGLMDFEQISFNQRRCEGRGACEGAFDATESGPVVEEEPIRCAVRGEQHVRQVGEIKCDDKLLEQVGAHLRVLGRIPVAHYFHHYRVEHVERVAQDKFDVQ
jgi:hypothetical protein